MVGGWGGDDGGIDGIRAQLGGVGEDEGDAVSFRQAVGTFDRTVDQRRQADAFMSCKYRQV